MCELSENKIGACPVNSRNTKIMHEILSQKTPITNVVSKKNDKDETNCEHKAKVKEWVKFVQS